MKMLLYMSAGAFAAAALAWFFSWAIWIHAPKAAYGPAPDTIAVNDQPFRAPSWYRGIMAATLILGLTTAVIFLLVTMLGRW